MGWSTWFATESSAMTFASVWVCWFAMVCTASSSRCKSFSTVGRSVFSIFSSGFSWFEWTIAISSWRSCIISWWTTCICCMFFSWWKCAFWSSTTFWSRTWDVFLRYWSWCFGWVDSIEIDNIENCSCSWDSSDGFFDKIDHFLVAQSLRQRDDNIANACIFVCMHLENNK